MTRLLMTMAFSGVAILGAVASADDGPQKDTEKQAATGDSKRIKGGIDLKALAEKLRAAVASGAMSEAQAKAAYDKATMAMKDPAKQKIMGGAPSFYSIVIGRLKSKDLELGEFLLDVDYVTSIYGDRRLKETILGKTVKVVGVSGPWLDTLLLIKPGETLKLRSGTLQGTTISLSPKATVLERAAPFDAETYPIPPEAFRGFQGALVGTIVSKSSQGYDLTMRVEKVVDTFPENKAAQAESIEGRLIDMNGFFNQTFRASFDDLRLGDRVRVGAAHRVPETDALEVAQVLEKMAP